MSQYRHEPVPASRTCSRCLRSLPLNEQFFYRDHSRNPWTASAWRHWCKECTRASIKESQQRKLADNPRYDADRSKRHRDRLREAGEVIGNLQPPGKTTARGKARLAKKRRDKLAARARQTVLSEDRRLLQAIRMHNGLERHDPVKERIQRTCEVAARKRFGLDPTGITKIAETSHAPLDADHLDHIRQLEILRDRHRAQHCNATATDSIRLPFGAGKTTP